jgi:hypothetical protein
LPARWLPVDPDLTQPGNRPSLVPDRGELPDPTPPKPRHRWPVAALAVLLLVAGALGGFGWWRHAHDSKTFTDDDGFLRVTVPTSWAHDVSLSGWMPPDSPYTQAAMSIGTERDWQASGDGVFVGLMPESRLPTTLPHHPACSSPGATETSPPGDGDPTVTAVSTGCPGGGVIIERAQQVSSTRLLWVQVRGDRSTAEQVLASVRARGLS